MSSSYAYGGLHRATVHAALDLDGGAAVEPFLHEREPVADNCFVEGGGR